jgi:hypothetical protein
MKIRSSSKISETQQKTKIPVSKVQEDKLISEMINSIENQEAREKGESKALRILGEECEAAYGGSSDPEFEGYYDIFPMAEIENPFHIIYQDLPKDNISM